LNFKILLALIMTFKSSIQRELDQIYQLVCDSDVPLREVSKSAFSQARSNIDPEVFINLNKTASSSFYKNADFFTWSGMRLLSIDGSTLGLPNHPSNTQAFGSHGFGPHADSSRTLARVSLLYDVLNQVTLDSQMAPYASHELDMFSQHLSCLLPCDLVLMDRGYSAIWVLFALKARQVNFCVRMRENWWHEAKSFLESGENNRVVEFSLPQKDWHKLENYPQWQEQKITCRLVRVELGEGKTEILCTSLLDEQMHPTDSFKELYHQRWKEEEAFKMLKSRMNIEQFSGKTERAVRQDFHAKVLTMTLCAIYAFPVQERIDAENQADQKRKHPKQINKTNAMANTYQLIRKASVSSWIGVIFDTFDKVIRSTTEIVRLNRNLPRKHKPRKIHPPNYKPI
jgi:hypothetical protein